MRQQKEHSEEILHNGTTNWTRQNEMRKMLFRKQHMHKIDILLDLCCDIDFEDCFRNLEGMPLGVVAMIAV